MNKFKGTGVALVTPFNDDKTVDYKSLKKLVEHVITNGVDFLVVLGTTGETATLTKDEKNEVLDFVIEVNNHRLPIVAGFGGNNTDEIINSIKARDFKNIDAILSVTPYYNKPSQAGIYEHYKAISKNSPVPIILYNVPGRTALNMTAETTLKLAHDFENIIAVKEASGNFPQIMEIVKNKPKDFMVISGDDALTMPLMSVGVEGVISVVANVLPSEFAGMVRFANAKDFFIAYDLHYNILDFINALFEDGNPGGIKAALSIKGIIKNNFRLPLVPVNEATYKKLKKLTN